MGVVAKLIGMLKTNNKGFFKEIIENLTMDLPGDSYLVLRIKPMIPRGRPIIAICYKYNTHKFLSFIVTYNTGSTRAGLPYLYKYTDQFSNVTICPVARPLVMYKLFRAVNDVDSHKKIKTV